MLNETVEAILEYNRDTKRNIIHEPVRTVLGGTNTVAGAIKDDAMRLRFDSARDYIRPGTYLDPVLAFHLGRKFL